MPWIKPDVADVKYELAGSEHRGSVDRRDGTASSPYIQLFQHSDVSLALPFGAQGFGVPNNSSPQGQIFYANFTSANHPPLYDVYAVDNCQGDENVGSGNVPGYQSGIFNGSISGSNAIVYDMIGYSSGNNTIPAQCVFRH